MNEYIDILKNCTFFNDMNDEDILKIIDCIDGRIIERKSGTTIFSQGESIYQIGVVLSGSVIIEEVDLWGHRHIMSKCYEGDVFGESYAIQSLPLGIDCIVEKDCKVLLLNVHKLFHEGLSCVYHHQLILNLVQVLSSRLIHLNNKLSSMSKRSTREKILSYLSHEAIKNNSTSFKIPFNRQQLADYLCVERAAMSVEISKLQKEGYLKTNRQYFELLKKEL